MLYLKIGEDTKAVEQIEGEKLAFPESAPFMDFLMRNLRPQNALTPAASAPSQPQTPDHQGGV